MSDLFFGCVSLGVTVTLFFGGLRLRSLRRRGVILIESAIVIAFVSGGFRIITSLVIGVINGLTDAQSAKPPSPPTGMSNLEIIGLLLGLGEFAFMVVSLVWLLRNSRMLCLK